MKSFEKSHRIALITGFVILIIFPGHIFARHFRIALQSTGGKFVTAENGGGGIVSARRDNAVGDGTFILLDMKDGELENGDLVALKTPNGSFLSAIDGGGGKLLADKNALGGWETFKLIRLGGGGQIRDGDMVAFQTENGKFLVAENGGGDVINANRDARGAWETFKIHLLSAPTLGKLSGPFSAPQMIGPVPVGLDDTNGASSEVFRCRNSFLGTDFPNCYRNHEGTDFMLSGSFITMNLGSIDVYTVAPGRVVAIDDGHPDRCYAKFPPPPPTAPARDFVYCPNDPNNEKKPNFVAVLQDDGAIAYYYHLKRETVAVEVGNRVGCGQFVGKVGSSGVSSAPHMHFTLQTIPSNKTFPTSSEDFASIAGKRSEATLVNPYSPMLWQQLIDRIPKRTCGDSNAGGNSNPPLSCGLGEACSSQIGCQVGLVLTDGVCKRVGVPPNGNCDGNQLCGPGLECNGGKCKIPPPKKPNIKIP